MQPKSGADESSPVWTWQMLERHFESSAQIDLYRSKGTEDMLAADKEDKRGKGINLADYLRGTLFRENKRHARDAQCLHKLVQTASINGTPASVIIEHRKEEELRMLKPGKAGGLVDADDGHFAGLTVVIAKNKFPYDKSLGEGIGHWVLWVSRRNSVSLADARALLAELLEGRFVLFENAEAVKSIPQICHYQLLLAGEPK